MRCRLEETLLPAWRGLEWRHREETLSPGGRGQSEGDPAKPGWAVVIRELWGHVARTGRASLRFVRIPSTGRSAPSISTGPGP